MKNLSKSRYTAFCQCPKNLWLKVNKPEEATVDDAVQARFEQGNEVGNLARKLFGEYVDVTVHKENGNLDLAAMVEKTRQEMEKGTETICEASFSCLLKCLASDSDEPFATGSQISNYCAVDILRKDGDGWAMYEVKSSSFPEFEGQTAKLEKYAPDMAYQKWVLENCGIKVTKTILVCLNANYVRQGELDLQGLFVCVDMGELVASEYELVERNVRKAMHLLDKEEPDLDLSERCHNYGCAFLNYCKRQHGVPEDEPTVFDLYRMWFDKKLEHYHAGRVTFEQLRGEKLNDKQQMQVECTLNGTEYIDKDAIRNFLDTLKGTLYFLDFETMQDAVPQYDNAKVYAQIPFQYSLHIVNPDTGDIEHREFLAENDGSDPRRKLAERLCNDIPMNACTLAYNKKFECDCLSELAALYPDLAVHLLNIADHILDLLDPFRKGYYYVPAMGGSFSIKSVLPALFPEDPELNYHNLDARVQNGGDAMTIFPRIQQMPPEEAAACREALLRYCELDTWAMVKIWQKLKKMAE